MSKKIVSANYRNRKSEYKWLVRDKDQLPELAVACKGVTVRGSFEMKRADVWEEGFGCRMIAEVDGDVVMTGVEPSGVELTFDGYSSFHDAIGKKIKSGSELTLTDQGKMFFRQ